MKKSLGILLFSIFSATAFLFPENQKISYTYQATVKADNGETSEFESGFKIFGTVIVKSAKNGTFMLLKDITHTLISGSLTNTSADVEKIKLSEYKQITELPIYVPRDNNVIDPIIYAHRDDEPWSVEWKKAIVTQFILNERHLNLELKKPISVKEHFGFRSNDIHVFVLSKNERTTEIAKNVCVRSNEMKNFKFGISSTYPEVIKLCFYRNIYVDTSSTPYINEISSISKHMSEVFQFFYPSIDIKQSFKLLSKTEKTIDEPDDFSLYNHYVNTEKFNLRSGQYEPTVEEIINFIEINTNRMQNVKIDLNNSIDLNRDMFLLSDKLKKINESRFLEVYKKLSALKLNESNDMQQIYLDLMSYVNTKSSVSAIINLIYDNKIDAETSIRILRTVTYRYKNPDGEIIEKLNDIITTNKSDYSEDVVNAALLCITSMIKSLPQKDTLKKDLINDLKITLYESLSNDQAHEMIPLKALALSNLQIEGTSILDDINEKHPLDSSIITSDFKAMMMLNALSDSSDLDPKLMTYYQSIVLNSKESYEVRLTALNILLHRGNTKYLVDTALSLEDEELCTDYYRIFKNIVNKRFLRHCFYEDQQAYKSAETRMKKCATKKLRVSESLYDVIDYYNNLRPEFEAIMLSDLENHKFITLLLKHSNIVNGVTTSRDSLYMRFKLSNDIDRKVFMWVYTDVSKILRNTERVDIILMRDGVAIYGKSFTNISMKKAFEYLLNYVKDSKDRFLDFSIDAEEPIMTDIGMPIVLHAKEPEIQMLRTETRSDQFSFDIRGWNRIEYGLKVYNPMMDIWHGCRRTKTSQYRLSAILKEVGSFKMSIVPIAFDNDFLGYQTVGHTEVYIDANGHEQEVTQSCNKCSLSNAIELSSEGRHRKDFQLWNNDDQNKELVYHIKFFDCDKLYDDYDNIIHDLNLSFRNIYHGFTQDIVSDIWNYMRSFPIRNICGVGFRVDKSMKFPTINLELKTKFNENVLRDERELVTIGIVKIDENILHEINSSRRYKNDSFIGKKYSWKNSENFVISLHTNEDYESFIYEKLINISTGYQNDDGSSFDNSSTFEIKLKEKRSEEQDKNFELENIRYKECIDDPEQTYDKCVASFTALRECDFDIKYKNLNENHVKWMTLLHDYYLREENKAYLKSISENLEVGKMKANILYDFEINYINVSIHSNERKLKIDGLPFNGLRWFLQPYSIFREYEDTPMMYCELGTKYVQARLTTKKTNIDLPENWTRILSNCYLTECTWEIFAKKAEYNPDSLVFNMVIGNDTVDLHKNDSIQMYFNKKIVSHDDSKLYHSIADLNYMYLKDHKTILLVMKESYTLIEYDGAVIKLSFISYVPDKGDLCLQY